MNTIKSLADQLYLTLEEIEAEVEAILAPVDGMLNSYIVPTPIANYLIETHISEYVSPLTVSLLADFLEIIERKPLFGPKKALYSQFRPFNDDQSILAEVYDEEDETNGFCSKQ